MFLVALSALPMAFAGDHHQAVSSIESLAYKASTTKVATAQHAVESALGAKSTVVAPHATGLPQSHTVKVGRNPLLPKENQLVFDPEVVIAGVGDWVTFKFYPKNHTVNNAAFDAPCQQNKANPIYSGFVPVKGDIGADVVGETTFKIQVKDTKPIWLYCAQGNHCAAGMVGVINPPPDKTIEAFKAKAKEVGNTTRTPPEVVAGLGGKLETCKTGGTPPPHSSAVPVVPGTSVVPVPPVVSSIVSSVVPSVIPSGTAPVPPVVSSSLVAVTTVSSVIVPPISTGVPVVPIPTGPGGALNATVTSGNPAATAPAQFTGAASPLTVTSGALGGLMAVFALFL